MTRTKAILLAAFTAWPLGYMILFIFFIVGSMFLVGLEGNQPGQIFPVFFIGIFALHFLTLFVMFGLVAFYIIHLFKTNRIPQDKKALWAVVLFFGNLISMPIYWYLYIWKPLTEPGQGEAQEI